MVPIAVSTGGAWQLGKVGGAKLQGVVGVEALGWCSDHTCQGLHSTRGETQEDVSLKTAKTTPAKISEAL